jgi:hypothetical protein
MNTDKKKFGCLAAIVALSPALFTQSSNAQFSVAEINDKSLGLWEGKQPVFVYNYGVISRTNVPADRARSSYVHPLYGLDGEVLTDDFPKDHYHHRGLFWAWPHVKVGTEEADLWMLKGIRHRFGSWLARDAGKTEAILGVKNFWFIEKRKVVEEEIWFRVHPATNDSRAIDVALFLKSLDEPLTLRGAEGKSYGGLTLRFAPRTGETIITTRDGRTKEDLPITHLPWADLTAKFASAPGPSGAAIFIDPAHPDYPPEWLTRHYGVLCVGWPGVDGKTLPPGKPIRCRYRVWIHRGSVDVEALKNAYADYSRRSMDHSSWPPN